MSVGALLFGGGLTALFGQPAQMISGFALWPATGAMACVIGAVLFLWGLIAQRRTQDVLTGIAGADAVRIEIAKVQARIDVLKYKRGRGNGLTNYERLDRLIAKNQARLKVLATILEIASARDAGQHAT